jgi:hypothetical protein
MFLSDRWGVASEVFLPSFEPAFVDENILGVSEHIHFDRRSLNRETTDTCWR